MSNKPNQPDQAKETTPHAAAVESFIAGHQDDKMKRFDAVFGGGAFKKLIGQIIQGVITSLLSGAFAAPQQPLDSVMAHQSEKMLAEVQTTLSPQQLAVLNSLSIDWKKLLTAIIQAILASISTINSGGVPESQTEKK